jgi:phage shock protein PspC (stress-responsive transcriptional regulator)
MKKTIKINISGTIFHLDEDAYDKLKIYLDKIHHYFEKKTGGSEIIKDIELRIAELFQLKLTGNKQVITLEDVKEVIQQLGEPEDFSEEDEDERKTKREEPVKKLYRDPDNSVLGGVASGIGNYINIDPVWIRLLFILLMLAYGVIGIIYILLWLIIPKAETYEQKLEMKGENITISNIEYKVRNEYNEVRDNLNQFRKSKQYKNMSDRLREILTVLGNIFLGLLKFAAILAGVGLIIAGIVLSFSFFGATIGDFPFDWFSMIDGEYIPVMLFFNTIFDPITIFIFISAVSLLVIIPFLVILYLFFRLLGFKGSDKVVFPTSIILWFISLVLVIGMGIWQFKNFAFSASVENNNEIVVAENKPFEIKMANGNIPDYYIEEYYFNYENNAIQGIDEANNLYITPKLKIRESPTDHYQLNIKKTSNGASHHSAAINAQNIDYGYYIEDSALKLDRYFIISNKEKFSMQRVMVTLSVPRGKRIFITEEAEEYLQYIKTDRGWDKDEMGSKTWIMGENELILNNPPINK